MSASSLSRSRSASHATPAAAPFCSLISDDRAGQGRSACIIALLRGSVGAAAPPSWTGLAPAVQAARGARAGGAGSPPPRPPARRAKQRRRRPRRISSPCSSRCALTAAPVDDDSVQAPLVVHGGAAGVADDQRVAARHRRIVEPDVGGEAATDARALRGKADDDDLGGHFAFEAQAVPVGAAVSRDLEQAAPRGQPSPAATRRRTWARPRRSSLFRCGSSRSFRLGCPESSARTCAGHNAFPMSGRMRRSCAVRTSPHRAFR